MLWLVGGILWASGAAPPADYGASELIKLAFAYGGFAVMAILMWFMLREQQQSARKQLDDHADRFLEALTAERSERDRMAESLQAAMQENHKEAMGKLSQIRDAVRGHGDD